MTPDSGGILNLAPCSGITRWRDLSWPLPQGDAYAARVEIAVQPEPTDEERAALLEVVARSDPQAGESAWRQAALLEATESDEP
jgi:hypothetical protein